MTLIRRIERPGRQPDLDRLVDREWLLTNGLGGYASGSVAGILTRRYHGLLIAAHAAPFGRLVLLSHLGERLTLPDGRQAALTGVEDAAGVTELHAAQSLEEFRLEAGLPVWRFAFGEVLVEKRLVMPHRQNTVHVTYRVLSEGPAIRLELRPALHFRPHDAPVDHPVDAPYTLAAVENRYTVSCGDLPALKLATHGPTTTFTIEPRTIERVFYRTEGSRGYPSSGSLWSPGTFAVSLDSVHALTLIASSEPWDTVFALTPQEAEQAERQRRRRLLVQAEPSLRSGPAAELVLAADQFVIDPAGRAEEAARAHASGDQVATVIAGYHWFTDWGRDTMISLEGLTLVTGRHAKAGNILRTFGRYMRDGLIPNLFPEGGREGLYHTADATLWFFHAIARYVEATGDHETLDILLPRLRDAVACHLRGTRFGIHVDPRDGLLVQGADGYQLTWMDAKVDGWVVTPRRGKAVEINALWYNALRQLAAWTRESGDGAESRDLEAHAERARTAFNARFWMEHEGYLRDVVDGPSGDERCCRPNQVLAISLPHPVLDEARWASVLDVVERRLLTPLGLRTLAPGDRDYQPQYYGDLRARDAAYHQGTVWAWLIGPFVDAWMRVHPGRASEARRFLDSMTPVLDEACVGSISEIFDAEAPFTPRGCIAQAWSVAEVLRCWVKTADGG